MEVARRADEAKVQELCAMGFPEQQVRDALVRWDNDTNQAASYLLDSGNQLVPVAGSSTQTSPRKRNNSPAPEGSDGPAIADKDLQEVIARSLQDSKRPPAADPDVDIQRAIMESLNNQEEVSDPTELLRDPDLPVGLMNVGNTCYFNSLLQFYFSIVEFRQAVFDFDVADDHPEDRPALLLHPAPSLIHAAASPAGQSPARDEPRSAEGDSQPPGDGRRAQLIEFMRSLQEVFALMQLGKKRYVDPSPILKNLRDPEGNPVKIGDQEDVMQFNDIFLQCVDRGLQLAWSEGPASSAPHGGSSLVERLFYGTKEDTFRDDAGTVHHTAADRFSQVVLQVTPALGTMGDSLEYDTTVNEVDDYTTNDGVKIRAKKYTWFKDLPPFLIFQLRRVDFDRHTQQLRKILLPFAFPEVLHMDPYCAQNAETTLQRRQRVANLKEKRQRAETEYGRFTQFEGVAAPLDKVLRGTMRFLALQAEPDGPFVCEASRRLPAGLTPQRLAEALEGYHMEVEAEMKRLSDAIADLSEEIEGVYSDMRELGYDLHSVLVHSGVHATSGHYWAFLPCEALGYRPLAASPAAGQMDVDGDPKEAQTGTELRNWLQFNDKQVVKVSGERVWTEGAGGLGHTDSSAYCVIYARKGVCHPAGEPSHIPPWLKEKVDAHNEALLAKCREHEQAKQDSQDLKEFQHQLQQLQRMEVVEVSESVPYFDPRVASFSIFLKYFADLEPEDFQLCCILEAYSWAFPSHMLTDLEWGTSTPEGYRAHHVLQALNVPYARLKYSYEQLPKSQAREHDIFHATATAYWRGLGFAEEGRWECAVQLLAIALFKDGQRTVPRAMLYARIRRALLYVLKKYFDDVCQQLENENAAWGTLLSSVAWIAIQHRQHLGTEEGLWMYFVCRWIEKQEALMAVAQRAGQPDWGTRVQELMMLLTQPDGLEAPGLVSAAPPPPPEDPAPPIGRPLAQGIYDREKALLPRFRAEEVNVRFHTASMVDLPSNGGDMAY